VSHKSSIEPTNCYELSAASQRIEQGAHRKIMPSTDRRPRTLSKRLIFLASPGQGLALTLRMIFPGCPRKAVNSRSAKRVRGSCRD
jgi:hypothetical protein